VKLPGYLDPSFTPSAPSIYSQLESRVLEGRQPVSFLIDTGSSVTTILDRDRERLGLGWNKLAKTSKTLTGIGGTIDTRVISDGLLFFRTMTGDMIREKVDVYVAKHDMTRLDRRTEERILQLPSLLGRDLIERYRLVYDKSRSQVYLER
jgi:hypothetical protein